MAKKEFTCFFEKRCGIKGQGCDAKTANAFDCGFIAAVEARKEIVKKSFLRLLRKDGVILAAAGNLKYDRIVGKAKILTETEIGDALDAAVARYCAERASETKKVSGETAPADKSTLASEKKSIYFVK